MSTTEVAPRQRVGLRQLPRLVRVALRLAWTAGRADLLLSTALQFVGGVGIIALLLLAKGALDALLGAVNERGSIADACPGSSGWRWWRPRSPSRQPSSANANRSSATS